MKVLIVGGTGHIGSYLVPRLVMEGHQVAVVARTPKPQYAEELLAWAQVEWVVADRRAEEGSGVWEGRMRGLEAEAVVDLICFTPAQNELMVAAFKGRISHFLHCGTIWAYGPTERAPYEEHFPRRPIGEYGIKKAEIEVQLQQAWQRQGFPATLIHPGHICGRKWLPIDPQGGRDGVGIYQKLAQGEQVFLPDTGLATLHHVHADDLAQLFCLALRHRQQSLGESFSGVAPYAMSLLGCCRLVAGLFGREPNIELVPLAELRERVGEAAFGTIESHVLNSPCSSIEKGRRLLGYAPRYTTEQIFVECLEYLLESGQLVL
ncbi:MAG: NAD-dependent epimerase/dehydratase family protein [Candidatus Latescibacteria bacterium]|nr:NAD-dependent epimerase/dehydratase family protein [Candidatus Latescibacterota bacterium]